MRELQQKYATSHITIVGALNLLERDGVIDKRQGSGCYVRRPLEAPAASDSKLIAFVTPDETELMIRLYSGIEQVCHAAGYNLLIANSRHDYDVEHRRVLELIAAGCQGIIMEPVARTRQQMRQDYLNSEASDLPIIVVDIAFPEQHRTQILFDNYQAGYDMTDLLIAQGHRRIAFMQVAGQCTGEGGCPRVMHRSNYDRYQGYRDALANARLVARDEDRWALSDHWPARELVEAVLPCLFRWRDMPQGDRPTAVIAIEDLSAVYAIQVARQLGIDVPGQLAFVGFDDLQIGRSTHPAFPTGVPDFRAAGRLAAQLVLRQIHGNPTLEPSTYVLPVPVIVREDLMDADLLNSSSALFGSPPAPNNGGGEF